MTRYDQDSFYTSLNNLFSAGVAIVKGIVEDWDGTFRAGVPAGHYVGDIFGTLGGYPSFGLGTNRGGGRVKRSVEAGGMWPRRERERRYAGGNV